jgi:hypothetical protein
VIQALNTGKSMKYYKSIPDIEVTCTFHMQNTSSKHFHFITCMQVKQFIWYLRFSKGCLQRSLSSCMWHSVVWIIFTNFRAFTASLSVANSSKKQWSWSIPMYISKQCILSFANLSILAVYLLHIQIYHYKVNYTLDITVQIVNVLTWIRNLPSTRQKHYQLRKPACFLACLILWGGGVGGGDSIVIILFQEKSLFHKFSFLLYLIWQTEPRKFMLLPCL